MGPDGYAVRISTAPLPHRSGLPTGGPLMMPLTMGKQDAVVFPDPSLNAMNRPPIDLPAARVGGDGRGAGRRGWRRGRRHAVEVRTAWMPLGTDGGGAGGRRRWRRRHESDARPPTVL
jgi:hypothetical protein